MLSTNMTITASSSCAAPLSLCSQTCGKANDTVLECAASVVDDVCVKTIKCFCDGIFARCLEQCGRRATMLCTCEKGVEQIECAESAFPLASVVAGSVIGTVFVVVLAVIVFTILRLRHKRKSVAIASARSRNGTKTPQPTTTTNGPTTTPQPTIDRPTNSTNPGYVDFSDMSSARVEDWLIDAAELRFGALLGQGAFGQVRRAEWSGASVAVKQIKKTTIGNNKAVAEFEAEIGRMVLVDPHRNVVQLFGVVELPNGDVGAVMEFCELGALVDALYGDKALDLSDRQLVCIAYDAACGLEHLHLHHVVHRDIAARNVLLAHEKKRLVAKLSDFGMAREVWSTYAGAEQHTNASIGPVRWMAPEQLERLAYSKASDVFAFGVLLYEIFARQLPWQRLANVNVVAAVMGGSRMDPPQTAPLAIRELMIQCWLADALARPSAGAVVDRIATAL